MRRSPFGGFNREGGQPSASELKQAGSRETFGAGLTFLTAADRDDSRDGPASLGDHDLLSMLDGSEIVTEPGFERGDASSLHVAIHGPF